jgi:4-diphosphocytidyl-2-C-methyl-D-erythritol kinase
MAKLNLSLRITGRRGDGYHNLVSLFLRLPPVEALLIAKSQDGRDSVRTWGLEFEGENVVTRALRHAREEGLEVPFLDVEIFKTLCPGSGLGAGSGNAAAVLRWLAGSAGASAWWNAALKTGADVPFLFSELPVALVSGVGEVLEPLEPLEGIFVTVAFPRWVTGTENAYERLDRWYGNTYPLNEAAARTEAEVLYQRLRAGESVGLLPNDFMPCLMANFLEYRALFELFDKSGYTAWGVTGSGAAVFALSFKPLTTSWPPSIQRVLSVPV